MMALRILLLFSMTWLQLWVHAQSVEWSNQQKQKSKTNYTQVVGENASGYYLIRSKDNEFSRELIGERYKTNLANDVTKELWQPANSFVQRILIEPSGLLFIALTKNHLTDKYDLVSWHTDATMNCDQTVKPITQIDADVIKGRNTVTVKQSPDKKLIYILYLMKHTDDKSSVLVVNTYQSDFTPFYSRKYQLDAVPDDVFFTSFECDNDGNAFLLADFPKNINGKRKQDIRNFYLYGIYSSQADLTEFTLGNDSTEISDIGMVLNNHDKSIAITGFFHTQAEKSAVEGMFMSILDIPTVTMRIQKYFMFDKALINKITSVIANVNSPGLSDLLIRKLIPRSDGGCIVLAEKFYETKQTYTYYVNGFPQTSSKTVYNFDEIIVFSLTSAGEIQFNEVIKKRQASVNDGGYYSSFVSSNSNNSLALIYSIDASSESDVMISTITPKGEVDTRILIRSMSYYVSLMPPESKQVAANTSLICALKDRKFSLMKVTF